MKVMRMALGSLAILSIGLVSLLIARDVAHVYGQCKYQGSGLKCYVQAYKVDDMSLITTKLSDDSGNYAIRVTDGLEIGETYRNYAYKYNDSSCNGWSTDYVIPDEGPMPCRDISLSYEP